MEEKIESKSLERKFKKLKKLNASKYHPSSTPFTVINVVLALGGVVLLVLGTVNFVNQWPFITPLIDHLEIIPLAVGSFIIVEAGILRKAASKGYRILSMVTLLTCVLLFVGILTVSGFLLTVFQISSDLTVVSNETFANESASDSEQLFIDASLAVFQACCFHNTADIAISECADVNSTLPCFFSEDKFIEALERIEDNDICGFLEGKDLVGSIEEGASVCGNGDPLVFIGSYAKAVEEAAKQIGVGLGVIALIGFLVSLVGMSIVVFFQRQEPIPKKKFSTISQPVFAETSDEIRNDPEYILDSML